MRVLFVSTLKRKVTVDTFASRSRIIFEFASSLVKRGHTVSLLGTGDSNIPGVSVIPVIEKGWADFPTVENPFYAEISYLVRQAKRIEKIANDFDIIHNHAYPEFINLLIADKIKTPMLTTIHAQATEELDSVLSLFPDTTLVSLSQAHRKLFKKTKIDKVVYNGIDKSIYTFSNKKRDYLLWIGRLSKAKNSQGEFMDPKGVRWAIQLAKQSGEKLLLTGNIEDIEFYNKEVKPYLDNKIQWIGPISKEPLLPKEQVAELMQGAKAFLMTINWEEPFGLVMAEAMSCGTPVIAYNRGSVSEVVRDGITGFVIDPPDQQVQSSILRQSSGQEFKVQSGGRWVIKKKGIEGLAEAVQRIDQIDRKACRKHVEENFTIDKMADNYENLYKEILDKKERRAT